MNARPLSAALLRRLAEAADGFRTGEPVHVVARYDDPCNGLRVFEHEADALEHLARAGDGFGLFGPFVTGADPRADAGTRVTQVAVTLRGEGGEEEVRILASGCDSLFWSTSAVDKFMVPYYARVAGLEYTARLRAGALGATAGLIHFPTSEWAEVTGDAASDPSQGGAVLGHLPWSEYTDVGASTLRGGRVASVALTVRGAGGDRVIRLDGGEYDAVFWSLSAIDKFAVPYYAAVAGVEHAAEMRQRVLRAGMFVLVHLPSSEYAADFPMGPFSEGARAAAPAEEAPFAAGPLAV